jgi:hypothetical protein
MTSSVPRTSAIALGVAIHALCGSRGFIFASAHAKRPRDGPKLRAHNGHCGAFAQESGPDAWVGGGRAERPHGRSSPAT